MDSDTKIIIINNEVELIKKLFLFLNITINNLSELENTEIDRERLLNIQIRNQFLSLVSDFKKKYSTSKLTALHKNCEYKQKNPQINLLRQVLKCNKYKLTPKVTSLGYQKNGKKLLKRSYTITKL